MQASLSGLWVPVATPFTVTGAVDLSRLVTHCRRLLADGASGLAILGTTSEANSLTFEERRAVIDACIAGGIPPARLLPGTGSSSIGDAIALTRHATAAGCAGVLLLPPFYYKGISDDGIFAFVARLIEGCGGFVPRILLYHIPPQAVIGWSVELIARLRTAFPGIIAGMKDSSGDLARIRTVIATFPGFAVFPGAETHVVTAVTAGAAGCITATANINTRAIAELITAAASAEAGARQESVNGVRRAAEARGIIPSVKAVLAALTGDASWQRTRPPLLPLDDAARTALLAEPAIRTLVASRAVAA